LLGANVIATDSAAYRLDERDSKALPTVKISGLPTQANLNRFA